MNNFIGIKIKKEIKEELMKIAKENNLTLSSYIKECVLNSNYLHYRDDFIELKESFLQILEILYRTGSNINQIAYRLNIGERVADKEVLSALEENAKWIKDFKKFVLTAKKPIILGKKDFK